MRARYEVATVLQRFWPHIDSLHLNTWQLRTLRALHDCRTQALGGHIDQCDTCRHLLISYNSCRNRHCPKCQGHKRVAWIEQRTAELLPIPYFHVVFTLPDDLNIWATHQPKVIYDGLFHAAWDTLRSFSGKTHLSGMIAILHTWGQALSLHPHLHCIVPGGFVGPADTWIKAKSNGKFLFPVKALSIVFRAKYLAYLRSKKIGIPQSVFDALFAKPWVVYAKRPFGSPQSVIEYLGRYTHKVAISNHRILHVDDHTVRFSYKDYRQKAQNKEMTLTHGEFIRRFSLHILPKGFVRIRHFGFLSSAWKKSKLPKLQQSLTQRPPLTTEKSPTKLHVCPVCKSGRLIMILSFDRRGPPAQMTASGHQSSYTTQTH